MAMVSTLVALGQAGFLDPSFGGTGLIQIGFGGAQEIAQATAVQANGLLVLAGIRQDSSQIFVLRLGTNNLPDSSFGASGFVALTAPHYVSQVSGMGVQSDGKIVIAGTCYGGNPNNDFLLVRLNTDGSLDSSYGTGGFAIWDLGGNSVDNCSSMALQADGKVVLGGQTIVNPGGFNPQYYLSLARFDTNGNFDASFGVNGVVLNSGAGIAQALALSPNGDVITTSGNQLLAYTTNGILDTAFGTSGKVLIPTAYSITALTIQSSGIQITQPAMIVAAGTSAGGALVARLSLNGALDSNFNGVGYVSKSIGSGPRVTGVRTLSSGVIFQVVKIVISGDTDSGSHFMVARFNSDGSTDTTFGNSGVTLTSIPGDSAQAYALSVMPGPRLVQVGTRALYASCASDLVVARYAYSTGALDTNFYGSGVLITNIGNRLAEANAVSIQHDGKIVVAGYGINACASYVLTLCRLNPDGTLDPSFGTDGKVVTGISPQASQQTPMVLQRDGRILVAGSIYDGSRNSVTVMRFLTNGAPDVSFGTNGSIVSITGTNGSNPYAMALQNDGKILVSANAYVSGNDIAILRYNTNGTPDTTWNGTGKLLTAIGSSGDSMTALGVQFDGKVVNSGASQFASITKFGMLRCNTNGTLDNSFGSFGQTATALPGETVAASYAMALQPDHKIILAGVAATAPDYQLQLAVARFNTNGTLDATFGSAGATVTPLGLGSSEILGVSLQRDGKIVAACRAQYGPHYKFAAARFTPGGTLDSSYGYGGVNYFDFATGADELVNAMTLDSQGRLVMVGRAGDVFAIARVMGDPAPQFTSIARLANQHLFLTGNGAPAASLTLRKATNVAGPYTFFASLTTDSNGDWQYDDASGTGSTIGFYRLSYP